ncbi:hypothetical protein NDN08_005756 [Rhodosorus marinus]|uniref:Uncharacterized protein n=1 Tax=Rhodosorus marinus TaxID=101924 RepID=A0AAV8V2X5_9RHOD|nr:hypothetical protein NDN08_005756 [Rhodosorus marinus]
MLLGLCYGQRVVETAPQTKIRLPNGFSFEDIFTGTGNKVFVSGATKGKNQIIELNTQTKDKKTLKRFNRKFKTLFYLRVKNWFIGGEDGSHIVVMDPTKQFKILKRCRIPTGTTATRMTALNGFLYFGGEGRRLLFRIRVNALLKCQFENPVELKFIPQKPEEAFVVDVQAFKSYLVVGSVKPAKGSLVSSSLHLYNPANGNSRILLKNSGDLKWLKSIAANGNTLFAATKQGVSNPTKARQQRITVFRLIGKGFGEIKLKLLGRYQSNSAGSDFNGIAWNSKKICVNSRRSSKESVVCFKDVFSV